MDAGHFQYESDVGNGSFQRLHGLTTDTWLVVNPTFKYGLTSDIDVEANIAPLEILRTRSGTGGERTVTGVGDLYLRAKFKFIDLNADIFEATLLPYIKAPIARAGLGNGAVEGGLILPVNYKLNSVLTLTTVPEVDVFKDATGDGRHLNTAQLINLGLSLPRNWTVSGELWGDWNFDPAGTVRQYSFDAAVAYGVTQHLQLDFGVNIGLNRATPGVQVYTGISQKF